MPARGCQQSFNPAWLNVDYSRDLPFAPRVVVDVVDNWGVHPAPMREGTQWSAISPSEREVPGKFSGEASMRTSTSWAAGRGRYGDLGNDSSSSPRPGLARAAARSSLSMLRACSFPAEGSSRSHEQLARDPQWLPHAAGRIVLADGCLRLAERGERFRPAVLNGRHFRPAVA